MNLISACKIVGCLTVLKNCEIRKVLEGKRDIFQKKIKNDSVINIFITNWNYTITFKITEISFFVFANLTKYI